MFVCLSCLIIHRTDLFSALCSALSPIIRPLLSEYDSSSLVEDELHRTFIDVSL